jgi:hypothetical protein
MADIQGYSDEQINSLARVSRRFISNVEAFSDAYREMEDGYNYLASDQYDPETEQYYDRYLSRRSRVYNLVWAQFNTLYGQFLSETLKMRIKPDVGGTYELAEVFADLIQQAKEDNEFSDVIAEWLLSGFVKQGFIYARYNSERHRDGSVVITTLDPRDVVYDVDARDRLLRDAEYWSRSRWLSRDAIIDAWPAKEREIREQLARRDDQTLFISSTVEDITEILNSPSVYNSVSGKYRVVEHHYFQRAKGEMVMDTRTGKIEPFVVKEDRRRLFLRVNPHMRPVPGRYTYKQKRIKSYIPGVMLELSDVPNNLQDEQHDLVPLSVGQMYVRKQVDTFGIFRLLKDSQDAFNEFSNTNEHLASKAANPPRAVKMDKIRNWQEYKLYGRQPGFDIHLENDVARVEEAIQDLVPDMPQIAEAIRQTIAQYLPMISGITQNLAGQAQTAGENASLFAQRVQQGLIGFQPMFAAFRQSMGYLYEKMQRLIVQNYTSERVFRIYDRTPYGENDKTIAINMAIGNRIINDLSVGRYKVLVDDSYGDSTNRYRRLLERMEIANFVMQHYGVSAPLDWVLDDIDIANGDKLIDAITRQQAAMAEQAAEEGAIDTAERVTDMGLKYAEATRPEQQAEPDGPKRERTINFGPEGISGTVKDTLQPTGLSE